MKLSLKHTMKSTAPALLIAPLALLVSASAWGQTPASAAQNDEAKTTFATKCAMCHGPDGAGTELGKSLKVVDLRSPAVRHESNAQLAQIIANGKNNMPKWKDKLSGEQIEALVSYVRGLARKKPAAGTTQK